MEIFAANKYLRNNPNFTAVPNGISKSYMEKVYENYLKSLLPYSTDLRELSPEELNKIAKEEVARGINSDKSKLVLFTVDGDLPFPTIIGFAIVGTWPNSYCYEDLYIQEFYIDKPHQHYGEQAIDLLIRSFNALDYSLFILEDNKNALAFWNHVMEKQGFLDMVKARLISPPEGDVFEEKKQDDFIFQYWRNKRRMG